MSRMMSVTKEGRSLQSEGQEYKSDCARRRRRHKHAVLFYDDDIVHLGESWVSVLEIAGTTTGGCDPGLPVGSTGSRRSFQWTLSAACFLSTSCSTMLPRGRGRSRISSVKYLSNILITRKIRGLIEVSQLRHVFIPVHTENRSIPTVDR